MARKLLRTDQWEKLKGLLPGKATDCGVTAADYRQFPGSRVWIMRTGTPWRDLPEEYGRWHTVYMRFSRWAKRGIWQRVAETMAANPDFEWVALDSTIVRAHQHAAGAKGAGKASVSALTGEASPPKFIPWSMR